MNLFDYKNSLSFEFSNFLTIWASIFKNNKQVQKNTSTLCFGSILEKRFYKWPISEKQNIKGRKKKYSVSSNVLKFTALSM